MRESLYCCYNSLFYNEVSCLSWLLDVDILLKYVNFYFLCVCVYIFGCSRTNDEVEELQHWCGNAMGHGPKEECRPRKGRNESRYSIVF